ncbi:MAG TPA: carbamoyltransferase C-terminal domain-containing protein [Streptosporangiaceae bacterium]|nr:carbamoyltransferase C-terminal domain-containing protein [Streptosporangiaceae bacterium]
MLVLGMSGNLSREDVDLAPSLSRGSFHDAAACLIRDGEVVAAVEEERFNRIKKTIKFPANAIRACLATAGVSPLEIDAVGHYFGENSVDQFLTSLYINYPDMPTLGSREIIMSYLNADLGFDLPSERLLYVEHHTTHALSCFIRSGMKEALVVVMDAAGENSPTTIFRGRNGRLETLARHARRDSLGLFYEMGVRLLGYDLGDEYKVMGLAPYGNADRYREVFDSLYVLKDNGDFELRLQLGKFFANGFRLRRRGEEFTPQHKDLAAGLQRTLEKLAMHVFGYWADSTGLPNLCFAGGVAHNSSLNGLILQSGKFQEVFIHPAAHDGGAAEGAAFGAAYKLGAPAFSQPRMRSASVGPSLGTAVEIQKVLASWNDLIEYEQPADIVEAAAGLLADGAVLGWAQGRSEYGPRALGNRSILADARPSANRDRINSMVKKREAFRPFAPVVTAEAASTYFEMPKTLASYEFMSFVVPVREGRRAELGAVTHVDGTARLQIVVPGSNRRFYGLVQRFGQLTGTPVLLNTSFNNNAEPIVQSVQDVMTCFLTTELDFLVVEDFLVRRRPGCSSAFDDLVVHFRPVTRLAKRIRITPAGSREIVHELYLDYSGGPRADISSAMFALLEPTDGRRTLKSLADTVGGLSQDLRRELYALWQQRLFVLRPR